MTQKKDKYVFVHSSRRVRISTITDEQNETEQKVFLNETEYVRNSEDKRSVEQIAREQKQNYYKEFFKKQFKNFLVLSGAGSSIDIGKTNKGMSMSKLWAEAEKKIGEEVFKNLCIQVKCSTLKPNLEILLSLIDGNIKFSKDGESEDCKSLKKFRQEILSLIKEKCNLIAPDDENDFPHAQFLKKISQRKATLPRIKIFTLNYDLLFEQAANNIGAVILDGFSFTTPKVFSGRYFDYDIVQREKSRLKDEDNFISRLFHLYKLHGSLNWERAKDEKGEIVDGKIIVNPLAADPLMVYPRESKYENSYEQPFFEMVARFQQNLRLDDSVLLSIGYSFGDKHINAVITEALNQNPGFQLVIINPDFDSDNINFSTLLEQSKNSERIIMIDETFADFVNAFPEIQTYFQQPDVQQISLS